MPTSTSTAAAATSRKQRDGYELLVIPLEAVIGYTNLLSKENRNSLSSFRSHDSANSSKSKTTNTTTNLSSNLPIDIAPLDELRCKFENHISSGELKNCATLNLQKLQFLDRFYDSKRKKPIKFERKIFYSKLNSFIFELIQDSNCQGLIIQNTAVENGFLLQFDMIQSENEGMIPLFSEHAYIRNWFSKQQANYKLFMEGKDIAQEIDIDNGQLGLIVNMFYSDLKEFFFYFQKHETKYCKNWIEDNILTLPKFLLVDLKAKQDKIAKYRDLLVYKEEDMNNRIVLDSDFEFIYHLAEHTSDWKLSKHSKLGSCHVYSSKENYTTVTGTKIQKYVHTVNMSIEKCTKAFFSYDAKDLMIIFGDYRDYKELDNSNSLKKYSSVVRSCTVDFGRFFSKRYLETVFATKGKFVGSELVEAVYLFKTCDIANNQKEQKNRCMTIGGAILQKCGANSTRFTDIKMFNVGGILQKDFIINNIGIKLYMKQIPSYMDGMTKSLEKMGGKVDENEKPIWRTFCDYARANYKIDPNELPVLD
ncbi:predicted protein [Naegleria gruberi]|uniref:Predicted protein n=1 Tax=Naegleria gruberi TaxID=5762 RepID=D2W389_NAEGR|nr:uncharacterized protein NAEGRDRAFT_54371 [Naegleria gruberi]EFC36450.1 predicted protein [Naegleria gruberi]|eukprot:XP_002669194.1 predicted protein [Naegleria gruberi strain NEG-M]